MKKKLLSMTALLAVGAVAFAAGNPASAPTKAPVKEEGILNKVGAFFKKKNTTAVRRARPAPMVSVDKVCLVLDTSSKKYVGKILANMEAALVSRISGIVMDQCVPAGAFVKKDQVLFTIDDTLYKARVMAARATVAQYEAELLYAQRNYDRQKALEDRRAVAQSAYEEAQRLLGTTRARLNQAKADLITAEENLRYTKIRAPFDGRMGRGIFDPGNYVTPTSGTMAVVVALDPVNVDFAISERDFLTDFGGLEQIRQQGAPKLIMANGDIYPQIGNITFIDNKVDPSTDTLIIRACFKNPGYKLMPGGLVNVYLGKKNPPKMPAISLSAILAGSNSNYVYVVDEKTMTVSQRPVKLGPIIGQQQLIKSGLKPGEIVVVDGTHKIHQGAKIRSVAANKGN